MDQNTVIGFLDETSPQTTANTQRNAHDFKSPMNMKMDESHIYKHIVYSIMGRDN
jgi:hypothetical protein